MRTTLTAFAVIYALAACAVAGNLLGSTPESQIVNGANTVTASTTLATTLLRNDRITVAQAKGYRAMLGTASAHLDDAAATLRTCRKKTGSTPKSSPDPCAPTVMDDIRLALTVAGEVQQTLKTKE